MFHEIGCGWNSFNYWSCFSAFHRKISEMENYIFKVSQKFTQVLGKSVEWNQPMYVNVHITLYGFGKHWNTYSTLKLDEPHLNWIFSFLKQTWASDTDSKLFSLIWYCHKATMTCVILLNFVFVVECVLSIWANIVHVSSNFHDGPRLWRKMLNEDFTKYYFKREIFSS